MIDINRIKALSHINRFNGWTTRTYSVLEHTVIGTIAARDRGMSDDIQRAFLLHDLEETEFGDITRPMKSKYMNAAYFSDVRAWNRQLCDYLNFDVALLEHRDVKLLDNDMLAAELITITPEIDDPAHPFVAGRQGMMAQMIEDGMFSGTHEWFKLFYMLFPDAVVPS